MNSLGAATMVAFIGQEARWYKTERQFRSMSAGLSQCGQNYRPRKMKNKVENGRYLENWGRVLQFCTNVRCPRGTSLSDYPR